MTAPATPSDAAARAAGRLIAERDAVAEATIAGLYAERPALADRYGATGRAKCLQDMHYTLDHLIPAVELEHPAMFATYAGWLARLLRARSVAVRDVADALRHMDAAVRARLAADEAAAVAAVLDAGRAAVAAEEAR